MKKLSIVLALVLLLTACTANVNNIEKQKDESTTTTVENVETETNNDLSNKSVSDTNTGNDEEYNNTSEDTVNTYNVVKEYTTPEGYKVIEYEGGYATTLSSANSLDIVKTPNPLDFKEIEGNLKLDELPENGGTEFFHDLRSRDLSSIDLTDKLDYLLTADFDDDTVWPDSLPKEFDIDKIKEYGMDPGLGVRKLHEKGITGKGVGIAIIDQPLLVNHEEYKDQLKLYEQIHILKDDNTARMHGSAVASIAVGKNVSVAPESDLYYIAADFYRENLYWVAEAIDRIIEINKTLPENKKIRVISISMGLSDSELKNVDLVKEAMKRAEDEGIYTIVVGTKVGGGYGLVGAGRNPLDDPNDLDSYTKGYFWRDASYTVIKYNILVPMDCRCVASPTGENKYVFYYSGGMSWVVPYVAGMYALCCQVNPNITPGEFAKAVQRTASKVIFDDGKEYNILNPEALINRIKEINN